MCTDPKMSTQNHRMTTGPDQTHACCSKNSGILFVWDHIMDLFFLSLSLSLLFFPPLAPLVCVHVSCMCMRATCVCLCVVTFLRAQGREGVRMRVFGGDGGGGGESNSWFSHILVNFIAWHRPVCEQSQTDISVICYPEASAGASWGWVVAKL